MSISKTPIYYQSFEKVPHAIQEEILRKGYNKTIDGEFTKPIMFFEYTMKVRGHMGRHLSELSQPMIYIGEEEIVEGNKKLKQLNDDGHITDITVEYYTYKR